MERVCHWKMPLTMSNWCRFDCAAGRKSDPSPHRAARLDIVKRDYEKKLQSDEASQTSKKIKGGITVALYCPYPTAVSDRRLCSRVLLPSPHRPSRVQMHFKLVKGNVDVVFTAQRSIVRFSSSTVRLRSRSSRTTDAAHDPTCWHQTP